MRRVLQAQGAEVVHLGHDRSVEEIASAAVQEDAAAVAVSSYQGGHMEFFRYLVDRLTELGAPEIQVYGGGGGTITEDEADFGQLASEHSRHASRASAGMLGWIGRSSLPEEASAKVFAAAPSDVVGPFAQGDGHRIYRVEETRPAQLGDELALKIRRSIVEQRIAEHLRSKGVEMISYWAQ